MVGVWGVGEAVAVAALLGWSRNVVVEHGRTALSERQPARGPADDRRAFRIQLTAPCRAGDIPPAGVTSGLDAKAAGEANG